MAATSQTIRKIRVAKAIDFDDQLWPVNVAIMIFAGFVAGVVIATSEFDDPRLLYNGWARLVSVALMMGLLFLAMTRLGGKMRRRVQLCLVISLIAHLWLAIALHKQYLRIMAEEETQTQQVAEEDYQTITVPDYHWTQIEKPEATQSFDEPIEREAPKPKEPEAVSREVEKPPAPPEQKPVEESDSPQRQQPNPAVARRIELTAPRRADSAAGAQVSRQEWKDRPKPNKPIPEPEPKPQAAQSVAIPKPNIAPQQRKETPVKVDQRQLFEEPSSTPSERVEVRMARQAVRAEAIPDVPATPRPTPQVDRPAEVPRTEAAAPEPVETAQSPTEIQRKPNLIEAQRRTDVAAMVREPSQQTPTPTAPEAEAVAAAATQRRANPAPRPTEPRRAAPAERPQEAPQIAAARVESTPVAAPATPAAQPGAPAVRPSTATAAKAADRPVRIASDQPPGRELPTMTSADQLPSAIASRRETAVQQQPAGSDATPARPTTLARSARGASIPSTAIAIETEPAVTPAAAGGTTASRLPTASDAAVRRSAAGPPARESTAAAGVAEFAVGSTQVVARSGRPRTTATGQPSATATTQTPRISRAVGPAPSLAATGAADAAAAPTSSQASAARGPAAPSLKIQSSAVSQGGAVRPIETLPTIGAGPPRSSGTPGPVGVTQRRRVSRYKSIESGIVGGSAAKPGRTTGGAVSLDASAEILDVATVVKSGGKAVETPVAARAGGPRARGSGLPGSVQSRPMMGAPSSLTSDGAPLASAVARRATASQRQQPGQRDIAATRSVTMKQTSAPAGLDLPSTAVPVDKPPLPGAGGVSVAQGGLPSSLQVGPSATVRRSAAKASVAKATAASASAESGLGSARVVALAGRVRAGGDDVPAPSASARVPGNRASAVPAGPARKIDTIEEPSGAIAEAPKVARAGPATGGAEGAPEVSLRAHVSGPQRQMAGLRGDLIEQPAVPAATQSGPEASTPGTVAGRRRVAQGQAPGPSLAAQLGRAPIGKTDVPGLPQGVAEAIDQQPIASAPAETRDVVTPGARRGTGQPSREEGGLPVQISAELGPGGLSSDPLPEVGLPSRRARRESEIVHTVSRRFVVKRSGGQLAIDGHAKEPTEAFRHRDAGRRAQAARKFGSTPNTERAVEMGLDYFARHQFPDGHWSLDELPEGIKYDDPGLGQMKSDSAATGLALLTYLGAGYTHLDDKHRTVVNRGVDWLVRNQMPNGDLFSKTKGTKYTWLYSHAIAAMALCEAYGMTQDPELREPARKAVDFIVKTQHRTRGGWRYALDTNGVSTETDTSVSGWMLMALKSAQMAGLDVPDEALERVGGWLDSARAKRQAGRYIYNPHADRSKPEQLDGLAPSLAMTSEAMLMRMYLGRKREDSELIEGAKYIENNLPQLGTRVDPKRNCYYWYYATQAMFQMRGESWTAWNDQLRPLAEATQTQTGGQAGSWHPARPVKDRWGQEGGRHYVTALHLLMLEVYYRHLPLFRELSK